MVSELKILGVILDSKLTFEKQVRAIAATASMRVGILRKTMSVFRDVAIVAKCFWAFILPVLEYCSPVWISAATSHLSLLDCVVSQVSRLSGGSVSCDLWHRRKVASLSVFFKIDGLVDHPVRGLFPVQKLQSIAFFYKVDCPLFLPFLWLFIFHFSFSRDLLGVFGLIGSLPSLMLFLVLSSLGVFQSVVMSVI